MTHERSYGKTPKGGDYSEIWYLNSKWEPVEKEEATMAEVTEYKSDGSFIASTIALFNREDKSSSSGLSVE